MSVGIPVRDGAATLARAVESVRRQSYAHLEIVISDNCSTDETETIGRAYAERDARVRYVRQPRPLSAVGNFRFVADASRGDYFMWAAHDDSRSERYVETLLAGFDTYPSASLVFSNVILFDDEAMDGYDNLALLAHDFDTQGLSFAERVKKQTQTAPLHIYGLIRRRFLASYPWYEVEYAPDWPIILWLLSFGDFAYVPGAVFLYYWPPKKTLEQRALATAYRKPLPFPRARVAWACAMAVARAERMHGRKQSPLALFPRIYFWQNRGLKNLLFGASPRFMQALWSRWKQGRKLLSHHCRRGARPDMWE